jgi:hypothetical protein
MPIERLYVAIHGYLIDVERVDSIAQLFLFHINVDNLNISLLGKDTVAH